jgi:hypothetical protein
MLDVQVRSYNGGLNYFNSVTDAFEYAKTDFEVWKISWHEKESQRRVRFVRMDDDTWKFEPLLIDLNIEPKRKSAERL